MAPCTLSCGWLSKMPSRLWSLWLDAFALANPAASVPLSLPAKLAVRNALLMVASETVLCVVRSRSGLAGVRPRAAGCSKTSPPEPRPRHSKNLLCCSGPAAPARPSAPENAAKRAVTGASNCALNCWKVGMKAALLGSSTSSNIAAGTRGVLVAIPVRQGELRIAAELANGGLQPSDIGAVPGEKPPVLVRAVEDVDESVAVPVAGIRCRPVQHFTYPLLVAVEDARRHSRIGDLHLRNLAPCAGAPDGTALAARAAALVLREVTSRHGRVKRL